ncbi:electron transfer flavoprotein-ubiquinone oxidoreductase [Alteromonas gilva]|uniref:Electron transfer flavoprotein-ubiquinone oxidoreductase n=1 Tax=Alteromonas gilva TaxID=2987522 RepID=A0ABT5L5T2_9ALTE|nr:electron transfer flavoprotein-ubiquinone oxidoreductase [Alteromonas gilva]MDC8831217.1 electron transfer flavoprotein-ubiquinone oxidoreductase [Alteromonas gilva]
MERESMEFDIVIVGAGPAGLSSAIRAAQQAAKNHQELTICVIEKGSEVGAHILSGGVMEPGALEELIPDWQNKVAPLNQPVTAEATYLLRSETSATRLPDMLTPKTMHNQGNYIVSLANLCRWLAEQAEALGVEIFPGFAAAEILYNDDGSVGGVITGDMGVAADGSEKDSYIPGMALKAKYTLFAEGSRGHLGKALISQFELDKDKTAQHYAIGFKEIWQIPPEQHQAGLVIHCAGWPLNDAAGGGYLYHAENNQVLVGLIVDLNYQNPYLSPFDEFQRLKHHPLFASYLTGGERIAYGARAITKGGYHALPQMAFPGGCLIGCNAGTLNFSKIKGIHTAIKSGIVAADTIVEQLSRNTDINFCTHFNQTFKNSDLCKELYKARNFGPALHKFGNLVGGAFNTIEQNLLNGNSPFTIKDTKADFSNMKTATNYSPINYPKPDNKLSFDKLSSVYLANTSHDEDQPCHLQLKDKQIPITVNLPEYAEPAQRYCPAGVYEIVNNEQHQPELQINAANCVHCKTCDIKDPSQNIRWFVPEGGSGPNYPNM